MDHFDWNKLSRTIYLNEDFSRVYQMIGTPAGLTEWFLGRTEFTNGNGYTRLPNELVQTGDEYLWEWLAVELELKGKMEEVDGKSMVRFTFGKAGVVTISLTRKNERTRLELSQVGHPDQEYDRKAQANCFACWTFFLTNLKSVVEHGIDLRETWEGEPEVEFLNR